VATGAATGIACAKANQKTASYKKEIPCKLNFSTAKNYWDMMTEIAAPIVGALSKADDSMITTIKNEVYQIINDKYPNQEVIINGSCLLLHGEK
jgi:hypothetical protein